MKIKSFDPFTSGLLLGAWFSIGLACLFDSDVKQGVLDNSINILTVFVAIIAAWIALYGVNKQIAQQANLAEKRRLASLNAAKSALPLALSRLTDICETAIHYHLQKEVCEDFHVGTLDLAESTLAILKECIEHSTGVTQRWLIAILARYQIMHSRSVNDIQTAAPDKVDIFLAVDWVFLRSVVGHCFKGARLEGLEISSELNLQNVQLPVTINSHDEGLTDFNMLLTQRIAKLIGTISEFENGQVKTYKRDSP